MTARSLAGQLGARLAERLPGEVGSLAARVERAGLTGGMPTLELLGWKVVLAAVGIAIGLAATAHYSAPGLVVLVLGGPIGWFGIDVVLARYHARRRGAILRALPTTMDLLVLSLEAGMGLDRALRTISHEYRSALSDELRHVLSDIDLGIARGQAFERMAHRVGLEDLRALSRAIVQSEELGVSVVGVMQTQARDVRLSRRRAAEAEALRAPIKMLIPLVIFILPTLFMLLLGPVGLRAGDALSGVIP
jgi:tight adherence protein C